MLSSETCVSKGPEAGESVVWQEARGKAEEGSVKGKKVVGEIGKDGVKRRAVKGTQQVFKNLLEPWVFSYKCDN